MKRRGVVAAITRLFLWTVGIGVTFCAFILLLIVQGEQGSPPHSPVDCALVFGSAVYGWNVPGPSMQRRMSTAARLYEQGTVKRLIVTGGRTTSTDQTEAQAMFEQAKRRGVPAAAVTLENRAQSTWQNLRYSKPLVEGCHGVVAVSDGFHLARIRFAARLQGWGSLPTIPADDSPAFASHARSVLREFCAFVYYIMMGSWLDELATSPEEALRPLLLLT